MAFELPPTERPYGTNCGTCGLFASSDCFGVSTVRRVIGTALKIEDSLQKGVPVDITPMQNRSVSRSFRVLQRRMANCPGEGNDGRGDFRKSTDTLSGYQSAVIIQTALAQLSIPNSNPTPTPRTLTSSGHSFSPSPRPSCSEGREEQRY